MRLSAHALPTLIASQPRVALVVMAYLYVASAFIGLAMARLRKRPVDQPPEPPPADITL